MPRNDPYKEYRYESENFLLRQVRTDDAPDLWECYSDPAAVTLMNDDNCQKGFLCPALEDVQEYIRYWNEEYEKRYYIRPAIIHKETGKAVGTMEAFGGEQAYCGWICTQIGKGQRCWTSCWGWRSGSSPRICLWAAW